MDVKRYRGSKYKILSLLVSVIFAGSTIDAGAAGTDPGTPQYGAKTPENFAMPFGLEGIQEVNSQAIPNLVFLIDDSKRTGELLPNGETKLEAYKKAVEKFIRANSDKYRFGIASLYDIENHPEDVSKVMLFTGGDGASKSSAPGDDISVVLDKLNSLKVQDYEKAPIITSLTQVYKDVGKSAIIYRCQQSYVFVISDGDSTGDNDDRLNMPVGDDVIFPEIAAFTKMKGKFDPYVAHLKRAETMAWFLDENNALVTKSYAAGDLLPKGLLARGSNYIQPCSFGAFTKNSYDNANSANGWGLCYVYPSPDGYSTYAHFPDEDTHWDKEKDLTHYFDDPEYPVQSIYTSWFSSSVTQLPPAKDAILMKNVYRPERLVSPETMALRGRGYYRFISSENDLNKSISEVAEKFQSNPALAMGRYFVPDVLLAGYRRAAQSYQWKDEEQVIYLQYTDAQLKPEERMKLMPILRAVNYPNRWASTYVYSQLDEKGTGKTEKYPDVIDPNLKYNDSFAGRDAQIQMPAFAMTNISSSPHIVNTTKGIKVIADKKNTGFDGYTDIDSLTNEDFGIVSEDKDRLKKTWPFYFPLGNGPTYSLFGKKSRDNIGLSSSKYISFMMYGIRPNILASYNSYTTWESEENIYRPQTLYDESYEPTTPAMENGVMFSNSVLMYGNKQRSAGFFTNNDTSSETGGGTVGMAIGVTHIAPSYQKQWTNKHYVFYGSTRKMAAIPSFQTGMVASTNNGEVYMFRDTGQWGLGAGYVYVPGAIKREKDETILQARTQAKNINYGDEDHPFRYVLNGQFAGVESRSYNYEATRGRSDTYQNIVVGTTGQGGKGVFSLNGMGWLARTGFQEGSMTYESWDTVISKMTTPAAREATIKQLVNWDSANNPHTGKPMEGLENIGYTIGQPILAQMSMLRSSRDVPNVGNDVRILAFIGNGYNGTEENPSLYVIDAAGADFGTSLDLPESTDELGKLVKKIEMPVPVDNAVSNALNGASLIDLDYNGVADIGYVADYNGNVYRLDFRTQTSEGWKATLIYKGDLSQPITTSPTLYQGKDNTVIVIFGTGSQIYKDDSKDTSLQAVYGIKDQYNVEEPEVISYSSRDADLLKQEFSEEKTENNTVRLASNKKIMKNKGWFIELKPVNGKNLGERIIANMEIVENTLLLNSYFIKPEYLNNTPSGAICSVPIGYAGTWQMRLNPENGGAINIENANTGKTKLTSGAMVYVSGTQYMDRLPPVNISTTKNFPYNGQGQILAGGKLYTPGKVLKPKECDGSDIIISSTGGSGGTDNVVGEAVLCGEVIKAKSTIKRLSWVVIN